MMMNKSSYKILFCLITGLLFVVITYLSEGAIFSEEAVIYRTKGYQAQKNGNITEAVTYYQKAIVLNPNYATPHNDLGIIYEEAGLLGRAEREYKDAIKIDPNYLDSYSNLAYLYERLGQIDNAVIYWKKRFELGNPDDIWTQKALDKLAKYAPDQVKEIEAKRLAEEMLRDRQNEELRKSNLAKEHYERGLASYKKNEYRNALFEFEQALKLTPDNEEIKRLKEEVEVRATEERIKAEIKAREIKIRNHCALGIKYHRLGEFEWARREFEEIIRLFKEETASKEELKSNPL